MQRSRKQPRFPETLESFWQAIGPILGHIFDSPYAPVDAETYSTVYSKCFNYMLSAKQLLPDMASSRGRKTLPASVLGYRQIDDFFAERAKKVSDNAHVESGLQLVRYILAEFAGFSAAVRLVSRMLAYMDRYLVWHLVQQGFGWSFGRPVGYTHEPPRNPDLRVKLEIGLKVERWGYHKDAGSKNLGTLEEVETWAEAGSSLDCIVPFPSLAYRRLRMIVLEPLSSGEGGLITAIEGLLDRTQNQELAPSERESLVFGLRGAFRRCGVDPEQPVRVKLESYSASPSVVHNE
ncbi:hypothetical protein BT96DRAFT_825636 [Gymnopus androsaceus JB14]|uniref:Cullin N-terminal domain-containing protein n=1 Tax=Gymnopus androsaceus JB14 TaxID=1447944 RepID=A0A6A4HDW4_9AGAR|nr:hypothetical protein BT96DRAFT_825636 [Gymnopus androsaceus JB14]